MVFKGLKAVIAFLTIFPVTVAQDSLETAARYMPFFPLVGLAVGAIAGLAGLIFLTLFPAIIAGLFTLGVLLAITGLHHTDGLLDFGDGLMRKGSREEKLEAMRDTTTGAGGFGLGLIVLLITAFSISSLRAVNAPLVIASAETTAKASMVLAARMGRSASPGLNSAFIETMHGKQRESRTVLPALFALLIGLISAGFLGLLGVIAGFVATVIVVSISQRHFGGLTGDVFGAINDIARMVALLAIVGAR